MIYLFDKGLWHKLGHNIMKIYGSLLSIFLIIIRYCFVKYHQTDSARVRGEGDIFQFCSRAPKLMTHWIPRVDDLLDTPLMIVTTTGTRGYKYCVELHWHLSFHKFNIKTLYEKKNRILLAYRIMAWPIENNAWIYSTKFWCRYEHKFPHLAAQYH